MGTSIVIYTADFSANKIAEKGQLLLRKSVQKVRALKADESHKNDYGGFTDVIFKYSGAYDGYCYCIDVRGLAGKTVAITFNVGYAEGIILANGGFVSELPEGVDVQMDGWDVAGFIGTKFISTVCTIESAENNTWVTKNYIIPNDAKWLFFTSKEAAGGSAGAEIVNQP